MVLSDVKYLSCWMIILLIISFSTKSVDMSGYANCLSALITYGHIDVNQIDHHGNTPTHIVCKLGTYHKDQQHFSHQ